MQDKLGYNDFDTEFRQTDTHVQVRIVRVAPRAVMVFEGVVHGVIYNLELNAPNDRAFDR